MKQAFSLDYLLKQRGSTEHRDITKAISLCREAGFQYVDYSPNFTSEDWEARTQRPCAFGCGGNLRRADTHALQPLSSI